MLTLKGCSVDETTGVATAQYQLGQRGAKDGQSPAVIVTLVARPDGAEASIQLVAAADEEDKAFDVLAGALEGAVKALRARGQPKLGVPVYSQ